MNYLSPSSLLEFERCQYLFWLRRIEKSLPYETTPTTQMRRGTMFDATICALHSGDDLPVPMVDGDAEGISLALAAHPVLDLDSIDSTSVQLEGTITETRGLAEWHIPLLGIADAIGLDGGIIDWKVGNSAPAGYTRRWREATGWVGGDGRDLDVVNPAWALQLSTYRLLLDPDYDGTDRIVHTSPGLTVSVYEWRPSHAYLSDLRERYRYAWDVIEREDWPTDGEPHASRCVRYRQFCDGASLCPAYRSLRDAESLWAIGL